MSKSRYCQQCGAPNGVTANFCGDCGSPFPGVQARTPVPAPPVKRTPSQQHRRALTEHDQQDDDLDDSDDIDDAYVPANLNGLEVDVEVYTNREQIGSIARGLKTSGDFERPAEKVPKNKKEFQKDFMEDFQREAGTLRKK